MSCHDIQLTCDNGRRRKGSSRRRIWKQYKQCPDIRKGKCRKKDKALYYIYSSLMPTPSSVHYQWGGLCGYVCLCASKQKGVISPKPERPHPPKLVCMHFRSTSTCMNFLSQFYFLTPMDYSPWSEGKFWSFLKASKKEP